MQACWNGDPDLRPTSRDLERTFNAWIESIAKQRLICPKVISTKKTANSNSETKNNDPAPGLGNTYENTPSQPLPSLSEVHHKILEEQDERRKYKLISHPNSYIMQMFSF
jgi:hypothetical protein